MKTVARAKSPKSSKRSAAPLRFAHPFFTTTPEARRKPVPGVGTSLIDHIQGNLEPVPAVKGNSVMQLADIIGAQASQEIQASGSISFHSVGDTGKSANSPQGDVAEAMAADYDASQPQTASPAFFFHLGDVIMGRARTMRIAESSTNRTSIIPARSLRFRATTTAKCFRRRIRRR